MFNFIKEDVDKYTNEMIPRKYFSGGAIDWNWKDIGITRNPGVGARAMVSAMNKLVVASFAMNAARPNASAAMTGVSEVEKTYKTIKLNKEFPTEFVDDMTVFVSKTLFTIYEEGGHYKLRGYNSVTREFNRFDGNFNPGVFYDVGLKQMPSDKLITPRAFSFSVRKNERGNNEIIVKNVGTAKGISLIYRGFVNEKTAASSQSGVLSKSLNWFLGRLNKPAVTKIAPTTASATSSKPSVSSVPAAVRVTAVATSLAKTPMAVSVQAPPVAPVIAPKVTVVPVYSDSIDTYNQPGRMNQDSVFVDPEINIIAVADGVGGEKGGVIASRTAIRRIVSLMKIARLNNSRPLVEGLLKDAVIRAENDILVKQESDPELESMATTISFAILWEDATGKRWVSGVNVGDSRIYLRKKSGQIKQLSEDDTAVQLMGVNSGKMTEEEAELSPVRNKVLDVLGKPAENPEDTRGRIIRQRRTQLTPSQLFTYPVEKGDIVLAMSDGISDNLGKRRIESIASKFEEPVALSEALMNEAKRISLTFYLGDRKDARAKPDDITIAALIVRDKAMTVVRQEDIQRAIKDVEDNDNSDVPGIFLPRLYKAVPGGMGHVEWIMRNYELIPSDRDVITDIGCKKIWRNTTIT